MSTPTKRRTRKQIEAERDRLIEQYIEPDPHSSAPYDVRIKEVGVHVWAIIGYLPVVGGDPDQVAAGYHVSRQAVDAAIAYYERNRAIIDARIQANDITRHW
jgi:uncharacterized protein (DUF433 family)